MDVPLSWDDLKVFEADMPEDAADAMIATVWSKARKLAPCLKDDGRVWDDDDVETVKGLLRSVVLRWYDTGSGAVSQRSAGDYAESYAAGGGGLWRPEEIRDLQRLCSTNSGSQRAFTVDLGVGSEVTVHHALWCTMTFGGTLCDCGAELSRDGYPLWQR